MFLIIHLSTKATQYWWEESVEKFGFSSCCVLAEDKKHSSKWCFFQFPKQCFLNQTHRLVGWLPASGNGQQTLVAGSPEKAGTYRGSWYTRETGAGVSQEGNSEAGTKRGQLRNRRDLSGDPRLVSRRAVGQFTRTVLPSRAPTPGGLGVPRRADCSRSSIQRYVRIPHPDSWNAIVWFCEIRYSGTLSGQLVIFGLWH